MVEKKLKAKKVKVQAAAARIQCFHRGLVLVATLKQMVTKLGMSDTLGLRAFGNDHGEVFLGRDFSSSQDYSDETAAVIDAEIHSIISEAYATAKKLLNDNIAKLHFVSEFLLKNEVMDAEQFAAAMDGDPTIEDLEEMTEAKKRKSREENDRKRAQMLAEERKRKEAEEKARREANRNNDANRYNRDGDPNSNGDIGPDGKKDDNDNDKNIPF